MALPTARAFGSAGVLRLACAALLAAASRAADPATDEVTALPGWSDAFRSRIFSGFLRGSDATRHVSYFFVQSESSTPNDDRVVVWLNGGPGCSSLIGAWLEQGPFTMGGDGLLSENAGRWSASNSNVLFLESPPGVGFSYVDAGAAPLPYLANDTTTSADSLGALADFFASFAQLSNSSDLWLSGESYAGIYVPWLARALLASPDHAALAARLKGILVGNGALMTSDVYEGGLTQQRMQHASNHGLFSAALRAQIDAACTNWTAPRAPACDALLATEQQQIGPLNSYDIEVSCIGYGASAQQRALLRSSGRAAEADALERRVRAGANPCSAADDALTAYMNRADVQAALHVGAGAAVIGPWSECAGGSLQYTRIPCDEMTDVYPGLLSKIAVLVYNGDQDECIPYLQDESWTARMGFAVKQDWRPWVLDNQVAGYVTEYDAPVRFAFLTVKQAGHEVPMYQPLRGLAMLQRFVEGRPF